MRYVIIFIYISGLCPFGYAQSNASPSAIFLIDSIRNFTNLNQYLEIVEDTNNQITFQKVSQTSFQKHFKPYNSKTLKPHTTYWGKLVLKNNIPRDYDWILYIGLASQIQIFICQENQKTCISKKGGYFTPSYKRDIENIYLHNTCKIHLSLLKKNTHTTIYFKVTGAVYQPRFHLKLITSSDFYAKLTYENIILFGYQGALWVMILYNLLLFFLLKDVTYFYYILYIFSLSLYSLLYNRIPGYFPRVEFVLSLISILCSMIFYFMFMRHFTNSKTLITRWDRVTGYWIRIKSIFSLFVTIVFIQVLSHHPVTNIYVIETFILFIFFFDIIFLIITLFKLFRTNDKLAHFFIISSLSLAAGVLFSMLSFAKVINLLEDESHFIQVGILAEVILFSLGLGYRSQKNEKEKQEAHQKIIYLQKANTEKLEEEVQERTLEIQLKNKELEVQKKQIENKNLTLKLQNDEISAHVDLLAIQNEKIKWAEQNVKDANEALKKTNIDLEHIVKERTQKLRAAYRDLIIANKELDMFMYRASHDLRGPVARFLGLAQVGKLEHTNKHVIEYFDRFIQTARDMDLLLDKLQVASEILNKAVHIIAIDFEDIVLQVCKTLQSCIQQKGIQIQTSISSDVQLFSDEELLLIILINLIENAVLHARPCEGKIPVIQIKLESGDDSFMITIRDNGNGIMKEDHRKIFRMFFKASYNSSGSGLGLYLVKKALSKLKGDIMVKSEPQQYTSFTVSIPVKYPPKNILE